MSVPIYVLGGSQTDFARNWAREGLSIYDMFRETLDQALHSTGINPDQIEVGHVGNFVGDLFTGQGLIGGFFAEAHPELSSIPTGNYGFSASDNPFIKTTKLILRNNMTINCLPYSC